MDLLTFIASIVESLAWPGVVIGALLYLRKELPGIMRSIRKFKYKDVEVEFGIAAKALAEETKIAVPESSHDLLLRGQSFDAIENRLKSLSELAPRAAILEAWLLVEATAADYLRLHAEVKLSSLAGPMRLFDGLRQVGILTPPQEAAFEKLRKLRNDAVHIPEAEFTPTAVANYIESALAMALYLDDVGKMEQDPNFGKYG